ncbi:MAG: hypothetical protein AB1921_15280, partial [Thermodesulfobacteriota bacterium]
GGKPFLKKGLSPQAPLPKNFLIQWDGFGGKARGRENGRVFGFPTKQWLGAIEQTLTEFRQRPE